MSQQGLFIFKKKLWFRETFFTLLRINIRFDKKE